VHYYIGLISEAVILFLANIIALRYKEIKEESTFSQKADVIKKMGKKAKLYSAFMFAVLLITAVALIYYRSRENESLVFDMERLFLIALLLVATFYDLREYRIPNKLLVYGTGVRLLFLIPEIIFEKKMLMTWVSEGIAVVAMFALAVLILLIAEEAFGMGDIKLFAVMGAFLGISGLFVATFYSIIVAGICSGVLVVIKKKNMKDGVKFAPFILIGTLAAFFVLGI